MYSQLNYNLIVKKIDNALTNEVYLDDKIIYKKYLITPFKDAYQNNEIQILQILNRSYNFKNNILSYSYINGYNPQKITKEYLLKCAEAIKKFSKHDFENLDNQGFIRASKLLGIEQDKIIIKGLALLNKKPQVLLHNDLVEGNFIANNDDDYIIIDFEYGSYGYFLFDIGSFVTERELTKEEETYFLKQFSNINLDDLEIIKEFLQLFWSKWANYFYLKTHRKIYQEIYQWKDKELKILLETKK